MKISKNNDPSKHNKPSSHLYESKDLVLSIRRLISREISQINHWFIRGNKKSFQIENAADFMLSQNSSEISLNQMTCNGTKEPRFFIRSEFLIDDLNEVFNFYFGIDDTRIDQMIEVAFDIRKRDELNYNRDIFNWFNPQQIAKMYKQSPLWTKYEKLAYGPFGQSNSSSFFI